MYRNLLETIRTPPNDKKTQTSIESSNECTCKCHGNDTKRRRKSSPQSLDGLTAVLQGNTSAHTLLNQYKIPVALNMQTHTPEPVLNNNNKINTLESKLSPKSVQTDIILNNTKPEMQPMPVQTNPIMTPMHTENDSDDIMMQLEKLFHTDQTDDDLFEATFNNDKPKNTPQKTPVIFKECIIKDNFIIENPPNTAYVLKTNDLLIENHAAQIKSLDERLATLTGILINNETNTSERKEERNTKNAQKEKELKKKKMVSKWHCEEYFLKKDLLETLYQIGDNNRNKIARVGKTSRKKGTPVA